MWRRTARNVALRTRLTRSRGNNKNAGNQCYNGRLNHKQDTVTYFAATDSLTPISGTLRPTTVAICRTCFMSSSNWSGNSDWGPSDSA